MTAYHFSDCHCKIFFKIKFNASFSDRFECKKFVIVMAGGEFAESIGSLRPPETKEQLDAMLASAPSEAPPGAAKFAAMFQAQQQCVRKCLDRISAESSAEGLSEEQIAARNQSLLEQCEPLCGRKLMSESK